MAANVAPMTSISLHTKTSPLDDRSQRKRSSDDAGWFSGYQADSEAARSTRSRLADVLAAPVLPPPGLLSQRGCEPTFIAARKSIEHTSIPRPSPAERITLLRLATLFPDEPGDIDNKVRSLRRFLEAPNAEQPMEKFARALAHSYLQDLETSYNTITKLQHQLSVEGQDLTVLQVSHNNLDKAYNTLLQNQVDLSNTLRAEEHRTAELKAKSAHEEVCVSELRRAVQALKRRGDELEMEKQTLESDKRKLGLVTRRFKIERDKLKITSKALKLGYEGLRLENEKLRAESRSQSSHKEKLVARLWAAELSMELAKIDEQILDAPGAATESEESECDWMVHDTDILMTP